MGEQKGCIIAKNDFGTLERVDGSNTCIGSTTLPDGKVITKRFRGSITDQEKVIARWEKWQGRKEETEDDEFDDLEELPKEKEKPENKPRKAPKNGYSKCPFSGEECGPICPLYSTTHFACSILLGGIGLYSMTSNIMRLENNESLELIAMAIADLKKSEKEVLPKGSKQSDESVNRYLDGKNFIAFVNLTGKKVHSDYKKFCDTNGYFPVRESELVNLILEKYPTELEKRTMHGGMVFEARM